MSTLVQTARGPDVFVDLDGYDRIRAHSAKNANERVREAIIRNVREYGAMDQRSLSRRIDELDHEWDVDRAAMAWFSIAASAALMAGLKKNKKWFYLIGLQTSFLFVHAVVGWCPPISLFRKLGFRTNKEIGAEKYALKTLRGDFHRAGSF